MSKAMSSAGADCVITLVEITSGPASAKRADVLERHATRDLDDHVGRRAADERHARADLVGSHVVEEHHARSRADGFLDLREAVALDLDRAAGPQVVRPLHRGADADAGEVVVLQEHEVRQRTTVVHSPTRAHRGLLERTQAGQRLAGVEHPHLVAGREHEPVRGGRDTRQVAQEVECRPLAGEHRPQRPGDGTDLGARAREPAVVDQPVDLHGGVELGEHLGRARGARDDAFAAHDDLGDGPRVARHERGGDVAERPEIFRQRERDRGADVGDRAVERAHALVPAAARSRTKSGSGSPANTNRPRYSGDDAGKSDRVCVPRDSRRAVAERTSAVLTARRFASSTSVGTIDASATRGAIEALGGPHHARVAGHDPLQLVADRCGVGRERGGHDIGPEGSEVDPSEHPGGIRRVLAPGDRLDHARGEHQVLQQRVRRQPVRAVDAGARDFPACPEAGERRRPVEVGADATTQVVRGRRHRQPLAGGVEIDALAGAPDRGEPCREPVDAGGVEPQVVEPTLVEPAADRTGDDVAWREVTEGVLGGHERLALVVAQDRAFAAQRFREQGARHRRMVQRRGVELHELEIGDRDTGSERHRDAVAGGQRRVRGDREALPRAPGRDDGVRGAQDALGTVGVDDDDAGRAAVLDEEVGGEPTLVDLGTRLSAPRPPTPVRSRLRSRRRLRGRPAPPSGPPRARARAFRRRSRSARPAP